MTDSTTLQQDLDALVKRHGLAGALLSSFHAHPTDKSQAAMQLTVSGRVPPMAMIGKWFNGALKNKMAVSVGEAVGNLVRKHLK